MDSNGRGKNWSQLSLEPILSNIETFVAANQKSLRDNIDEPLRPFSRYRFIVPSCILEYAGQEM